jgi:guanylate kinase
LNSPTPRRSGILFVLSAPSGAGKTTLTAALRESAGLVYSVSCTTRPPRVGEVDGRSYHFLSEEEFLLRRDAGRFLEHARVHDAWYGTPREPVDAALSAGRDVLMDIDVQGAAQVRQTIGRGPPGDPLRRAYLDVFIAPPSMRDLQLRLFGRGQDDAEIIRRRLQRAEQEMSRWREYDYLIVNDRLQDSYDVLRSILIAERHRLEGENAS